MLPIKLKPFSSESALGYCLRSITKNGGRLSDIRKHLNISDNEFLKSEHSASISQLLGIDEDFLIYGLPREHSIDGSPKIECYGNYLGKRNFLKLSRLQFCPICINKKSYVLNNWDLTFSCCCLEHGIVLWDQCPKCGKKIDANRPDISWGSCGHYLGDCSKLEEASQLVIEYQKIFVKLFNREIVDGYIDFFNLPTFFAELSLDAWISLIISLGSLVEPWGSILAKDHMRIKSTAEVICIAEKGMDRLIKYSMGEDISPWVIESGLKFVINKSPIINDRLVFLKIFESIFGLKKSESIRRKNKELLQLDLFE